MQSNVQQNDVLFSISLERDISDMTKYEYTRERVICVYDVSNMLERRVSVSVHESVLEVLGIKMHIYKP